MFTEQSPGPESVLTDNQSATKYLVVLDGKVKFSSSYLHECEQFKTNSLSENDRSRASIVPGTPDGQELLLG